MKVYILAISVILVTLLMIPYEISSGEETYTNYGLERSLIYNNSVLSIAWHPSENKLASTWGNTILIWDINSYSKLLEIDGHHMYVVDISWSSDGDRIVSASWDETIKVWDSKTGGLLRTIPHDEWVNVAVWSPDGKKIASGTNDGIIKIWDANSYSLFKTIFAHNNSVETIVWSPNSEQIVSGSYNHTIKKGEIRVFDASTGNLLKNITEHRDWVYSIAWQQDGKRFATGSEDRTIKIWDADTYESLKTIINENGGVYCGACGIYSLSWSPNGKYLASGSSNPEGYNTIKIWDTNTYENMQILPRRYPFELHLHHRIRALAWSSDSEKLASASDGGIYGGFELKIWSKDSDDDGYSDIVENKEKTDPLSSNSKPKDFDSDYDPDTIDIDDDNDGVRDEDDYDPYDRGKWEKRWEEKKKERILPAFDTLFVIVAIFMAPTILWYRKREK